MRPSGASRPAPRRTPVAGSSSRVSAPARPRKARYANVLEVFGIEGDHDSGTTTPEQAIAALEAHHLRALVYTSWSHTAATPRWRVLLPLARPVAPAERLALAEALNGLLDGCLAPESGVLSQSYYFGRNPNAECKVLVTFDDPEEGVCLDELDAWQQYRRPFATTPPLQGPELAAHKAQEDYLAELLSGEDVHGSALRIIGRLVREGLSDSVIRTVFAGLALKVREVRGPERAADLTGGELDRMLQGARAKGFDGPKDDGPTTDPSAPAAGDKLTQAEVEQLISWAWKTGTELPDAREQFESERINPKTGKPFSRLRVGIGLGDNTNPCCEIGWHSRHLDDFIRRSDEQIENRFLKDTGDKESAGPHDFKQHARQWAARVSALAVSDETARALLARLWPAPEPLTIKAEPEPYPLDALPASVRRAVEEVQAFVKAPLALVASSALSALSVAIQPHHDIERAKRFAGPVSLDLLNIADSGERKTTLDGFFTSAIRHHQQREVEKAKPEMKRYAAELMAWEARQEGVRAAIRDAAKKAKPTDELEHELEQLQMNAPLAPRVPRLLLGDETPENLAWTLAKTWPSAGIIASEAGVIFGSHGMSKDSIMRNLALLNVLWDGGELLIGRKTTESFTVRGVQLTVALQVQEATLRSFFERSGGLARGTGFLARFLVAWPESTQGYRLFSEAPDHWPHLEAFNQRLTAILEQAAPISEDGTLEPSMLTFSPAAKQAWIAFADAIEIELRASGELYDVRDVASKSADNAARLTALFHVFGGGTGPVSLEAFEGASRIAAWHLTEARRFFGELALPEELVDASRLDAWLIDHCRSNRSRCSSSNAVEKRHVRQYGPLRNGARLGAAIRELQDMGRIREGKRGRKSVLEINPALPLEGAP